VTAIAAPVKTDIHLKAPKPEPVAAVVQKVAPPSRAVRRPAVVRRRAPRAPTRRPAAPAAASSRPAAPAGPVVPVPEIKAAPDPTPVTPSAENVPATATGGGAPEGGTPDPAREIEARSAAEGALSPAAVPQLAQGNTWTPVFVRPYSSATAVWTEVPPSTGLFERALYYHRLRDFENALAGYRDLLLQDERNADAHNNLGVLYQERGMVDEAIQAFRRALTIDEKHAKAHNNLGVALLAAGSPADAASEFRAALSADPANSEPMVNLALALKALGRTSEAIDTLSDALERNPRSAPAHYNLAVIHESQGDRPRSIEDYERFLEHGAADHPELAVNVRKRIEILKNRGLSSRFLPAAACVPCPMSSLPY
jgi:Tfp pilus assembly protein PilF